MIEPSYQLLFIAGLASILVPIVISLIVRTNEQQTSQLFLLTRLFFIGGWCLIFGAALLFYTAPIDSYTLEKSGQFGDSFGFLTSIFSGLTLATAIHVYQTQKIEFEKLTSKTEYNNRVQRAVIQPVFQIKWINQANEDAQGFVAHMQDESHYKLISQNTMPFFDTYAKSNSSSVTSTKATTNEIAIQYRDELTRETEIYVFYTDLSGYRVKLTLGFGHEWQAFETEATIDDDEITSTVIADRDQCLEILSIDFLSDNNVATNKPGKTFSAWVREVLDKASEKSN